jgi:hypothetical protein
VPEPVADQQVELLVDLDDRIAELPSADGDGGEDQEDQAQPAMRRLFWSDDGNGTDLTMVERPVSGGGRRSSNVRFGLVCCELAAVRRHSSAPSFVV